MARTVTLGGDRLGSGRRQRIELHGYERSTHDLSNVVRTTMSAGTLVPFMVHVGLPGDTFDINLDVSVLTHPTIGPLYGSYDVNLDIFQAPIRLYNAKLQANLKGIGMDMAKVKFPLIQLEANGRLNPAEPPDNQQINPSCIFSHLNIRGLGYDADAEEDTTVIRHFNAIPWLMYWDTYGTYYANKQEEIGAVIHKNVNVTKPEIEPTPTLTNRLASGAALPYNGTGTSLGTQLFKETQIQIPVTGLTSAFDPSQILFTIELPSETIQRTAPSLFRNIVLDTEAQRIFMDRTSWPDILVGLTVVFTDLIFTDATPQTDLEPQITTFPLENIDNMRKRILTTFSDAPIILSRGDMVDPLEPPYSLPFQRQDMVSPVDDHNYSKLYSQEGLALRTYKSDLFNNWIQTEWIDGTNGINQVTKVNVTGGAFILDELNLKQKIYNMLNRIALSDGTYKAYQEVQWDHDMMMSAVAPIYEGGLSKNIVFQEVVSNAASESQPLGTLAGRGVIGKKEKGGHVTIKFNEAGYILGIVSITPKIDYSQGNKWDTNLKTFADLHVPALDEIGFQDLITDAMAWWDTQTTPSGTLTFKSAGKQPAWIEYMTEVNYTRGNFADQFQEMFMTLNRRYSRGYEGLNPTIQDLTTYIDPVKFNHIFADTRRDAQNFWVQIGSEVTARRKMSAKVIPNL